MDKYSFIKVVGRALFNDMEIINSTLSDLNNIGESLAYLTTFDHQGLNDQSSHIENKQTSKKQKGFSPQNTRNSSDLSKIAKSMNLQYDEEFLKKLSLLLSYGYKDLFEIQIFLKDNNNNNKTIFSTNLKRNYLKEDEHLLIKKHSRYSEKELVIFGVITQNKGEISNLDIESETNPNPTKMKEFLRNFNLALLKLEEGFVGISSSEIIIDPIAVYREL